MLSVCIVGLGQIGGSLGLALKRRSLKRCYHVVGVDRNRDILSAALKLRAVDKASLDLQSAKTADIVVICTPVDKIVYSYELLSKIVNKNAIITDVGSVKYQIEKDVAILYKKNNFVPFVGAHPMVGKEKSGIFSADINMFENSNVILTSSRKASVLVAQMWKDVGANIVKISAKKHDEIVAFTSHLPHVIAFLINKIYKKIKKRNHTIDAFIAGSFESVTRVAVSSSDLWAPIFLSNGKNVEKYLNEFVKELNSFKKILKSKNKQKIKKEILKIQE
ncbi:MAG: prephenate dehydrogenase/arogenate dehydrogenase family protein [Endomicrobium sp.]|jgi:prephenate dehydrogenase|nr:prephenate dehydrogenase/arogenate dehydrogenase family protein [Endomicrobium sp.]